MTATIEHLAIEFEQAADRGEPAPVHLVAELSPNEIQELAGCLDDRAQARRMQVTQ